MLLKVAVRNALRNRRRSAFTILAVSFGLLCLIVFQSLKVGLHSEMVRSTVELDAGSVVVNAKGFEPNLASLRPLPDPQSVVRQMKALGAEGAALRTRAPVLLLAREKSSTLLLTGIEPDKEPTVTFISKKLKAGNYPDEEGEILLGANLARSLGMGVGDEVAFMAQDAGGKGVVRKFRIGGLFETALASFDRTHAFIAIDAFGDYLRSEGIYTEAVCKVGEGEEGDFARKLAQTLDPAKYQVRTWKEVAPDVEQLIRLNDSTMTLLIFIVFAIVALGIVNTMSMAVFERFHEVGVMLAFGARPRAIFSMIIMESAALGVFSALLGTVMGLVVCGYLSRYGVDLTSLTSSNEYFATSHVLKARLIYGDLLWENLITIGSAVVAGVFPALKAVRLDPVEALHHV